MNGFGSCSGGTGVRLRLGTGIGTRLCGVVSIGSTIFCDDGKYDELIVGDGALNGVAVL